MNTTKLSRCPHPVGAFSGITDKKDVNTGITIDGKILVAGPLDCNSWSCPYCHDKLKKKLYKRIHSGAMSKETKSRYGRKFLTLTYGGNVKRSDSTPITAYEEMALAFHKLIKVLRSIYGYFDYFRVCELHKDGWPHFHVMMVGDNIAPKSVLDKIRYFWCDTYGMGFVKINCIDFNDAKHATNYMLKYITKDIQKVDKRKRIFSASRHALLPLPKIVWTGGIMVHLGSIDEHTLNQHTVDYTDRIVSVNGWSNELVRVGNTLREWDEQFKNQAIQAHLDMCTGAA